MDLEGAEFGMSSYAEMVALLVTCLPEKGPESEFGCIKLLY